MVLKSLKSLEGDLCKGYLAHFKLSLFLFSSLPALFCIFKERLIDGHECAEPAGQVSFR